jgi:murein DD-endopeptidase MepM/ murein hydrolase activator NlpD
MSWRISASVGAWEAGARNNRRDVEAVQTLLASAANELKDQWLHPGDADGHIAQPPRESSTVKAIRRLQERAGIPQSGLIEANGRTWNELVRAATDVDELPNMNAAGSLYFPFAVLPAQDWTSGMRRFGANRNNGTRAHAGCDLYFPQGTWIHAVADGKIVRGPTYFYADTYALEVDHGDVLVRYCEVHGQAPVRAGDIVQAGQRIARVGRLVGITVPSDMLHIEVYNKTASGPLTVPAEASARRADNVPFGRRRDLVDPTPFLNDWMARLPA